MKGITIEVKGLQQLTNKLQHTARNINKEAEAITRDAANNFAQRAKAAAPADQGILRNGISVNKAGPLMYEVVSSADYSAFVEFGTRSKARIPPGLEKYIEKTTSGTATSAGSAKEVIYGWCQRKGIEPRLWFVIYVSIMTKGIEPRPFFFPQILPVEKQYAQDLKRLLRQQTLKS